jgi:hypothetical protein
MIEGKRGFPTKASTLQTIYHQLLVKISMCIMLFEAVSFKGFQLVLEEAQSQPVTLPVTSPPPYPLPVNILLDFDLLGILHIV